MKTLTKLALVSAMAFSANAMAAQLQSLDDAELSATTGQDGITIRLDSGITFDQLAIHDQDGAAAMTTAVTGINTSGAGAILLGKVTAAEAGTAAGNAVELAGNGLDIIIDADDNAGSPVLNVNMDFGDTTLNIGDIWVASSDYDGANAVDAVATNAASALNVGTITLDGLKVNVQLGNQAQGAMIKINSEVTNGINIASLALTSNANSGTPDGTWANRDSGSITLGGLKITDADDSSKLSLNLNIDPTTEGLMINGLSNLKVSANSVDLGNGASIGGLAIKNLSVGDITIKGH